jgi:hypothetical protein
MNEKDFLLQLIYRLKEVDAAFLLYFLMASKADQKPQKTSFSSLAQNMLGGHLSTLQVRRATQKLIARGLITTVVYPKTSTSYSVDVSAVYALFDQPLAWCRWLPLLSEETIEIPFLETFKDKDTETGRISPIDSVGFVSESTLNASDADEVLDVKLNTTQENSNV